MLMLISEKVNHKIHSVHFPVEIQHTMSFTYVITVCNPVKTLIYFHYSMYQQIKGDSNHAHFLGAFHLADVPPRFPHSHLFLTS